MTDDPKKTVVPGEWYLGARCKKCGKLFPAIPDPSKGTVKLTGDGILVMTCQFCGHKGDYRTAEIQSLQARQSE